MINIELEKKCLIVSGNLLPRTFHCTLFCQRYDTELQQNDKGSRKAGNYSRQQHPTPADISMETVIIQILL